MITQHFLIEHFLPYLVKHGAVYKKIKQVKARPAQQGEIIVTATSDGVETKNTAAANDFVVQNITDTKEEYILKYSNFLEKYELANQDVDGWSIYNPKGQVVALAMSETNLELFGWQSPFYIEPGWKEPMIVKLDDFLVSPLPHTDEIYRVARAEFLETYAQVDK